jgi:hypothetical protein
MMHDLNGSANAYILEHDHYIQDETMLDSIGHKSELKVGELVLK